MSANKSIYFLFLLLAITLLYCSKDVDVAASPQSDYLNLADSVKYMGMETCRSCHNDVYESFIETGMGKSFDHATPQKSNAVFDDHALVYDKHQDMYYRPFFRDSVMYIKEFRLKDGDTTFQRTEKIDYIVGSGHHTNSHIMNINGYVFQVPITYYTQEGRWDMAPGFKEGTMERFDRFLTTECISCHNHLPKLVEGSLNKYEEMPTGIECERCHGPGEIHVREKLAGNKVDTSKNIDYSIVNPANLTRDLQLDICQRCHLQGVAVLEDNKTFFDFKPGMALSEVFNVFLPRYTDSHEKFIMASQADRLRLSPCFKDSEMTCLTCHHPHHSVQSKSATDFNATCNACHDGDKKQCNLGEAERLKVDNNCVKCHMPPSSSVDIPHVNITDHYISKSTANRSRLVDENEQTEIAQFLGLEILTKAKADPIEMAKGYIALYDKYVERNIMLDSAKYYLDRSPLSFDQKFPTLIHYYFAYEKYPEIIQTAPKVALEAIKDGWTAYRIGEAYFEHRDYLNAKKYYSKSIEFLRFNLDFQEKLGVSLVALKEIEAAKKVFDFVLSENPKRKISQCNLGFLNALNGDFETAKNMYDKALALDPDYEQALLNKAALALHEKDTAFARSLLERVLSINPKHVQAQKILQSL